MSTTWDEESRTLVSRILEINQTDLFRRHIEKIALSNISMHSLPYIWVLGGNSSQSAPPRYLASLTELRRLSCREARCALTFVRHSRTD
jgi:hypothetical protein